MKTKAPQLAMLVLLTAFVFVSMNTFQVRTGPHGGSIKPAGNFNIELKFSYSNYYAYLLDKENKAISNKGVSCEIRFLFPDSSSLDMPLKPYLEDGFSMESNMSGNYGYLVTFRTGGEFISAKFDNETPLVRKK